MKKLKKSKRWVITMTALLVMGAISAEAMLLGQDPNSQWNSPDSNYSVVKKTATKLENASCVLWINAVDHNVHKNVLFGFYEILQKDGIKRIPVMKGSESLGRDVKRSIEIDSRTKTYKVSWYYRAKRGWSDSLLNLINSDAKVTFHADTNSPYVRGITIVKAPLDKTYLNEALNRFSQCRNNLQFDD